MNQYNNEKIKKELNIDNQEIKESIEKEMNKFPEENDNKKIKSIKKAINEVRNL